MLTVRKILAATDLSEGAGSRMAYALVLARSLGAELHVLFADVLHSDALESAAQKPATQEAALQEIRSLTEAVQESNPDVRGVEIIHVVRRNITPAPAILDYADDEDVDLIVMGTHGRRGVRRLLLGSVAEEVVRVATCPVLALRTSVPEAGEVRIESILVPIDFSEHSQAALDHAKELAGVFGARLDLLHVVEETLHPAFYGITVQSVYDVDPNIEEKAIDHMRKMFEKAAGPSVEATFHAGPGHAAREIVEVASERGSGLIAMGTHGLTGLDHFVMGSTTERVLRRAECGVFVVKSFGKSLVARGEVAASAS